MNWDNPEPGVYEALSTRTKDVALVVFQANEYDADEYTWFAFSEGRVLGCGTAVGLDSAKAACEAAAA